MRRVLDPEQVGPKLLDEEEEVLQPNPNSLVNDQPSDTPVSNKLVNLLKKTIPDASAEEVQSAPVSTSVTEQLPATMDDAEIREAQDEARSTRNLALLLQATNSLGSGIASYTGAKVDPRSIVLDTIYKDADQQIKDIEQRREAQRKKVDLETLLGESDPNSPISQATRATALKVLPHLADDPSFNKTSARSLKQILPWGQVIEAANSRRDVAKMREQQQKEQTLAKQEQKEIDKLDKLKAADTKAHLTAVNQVTRAKGQLGSVLTTQVRKYDSAENGLRIIEGIEAGLIKPNSQVIHELAMSLASTFSGTGNPTVSAIKGFEPNNISTNYKKAKEFITSTPQRVLDKTYLNQYKKQLDTEKQYWHKKLNQNTNNLLEGMRPIYERKGPKGEDLNKDLREAMINVIRGYDYSNPYGTEGGADNPDVDIKKAQEDNISAISDSVKMVDPANGRIYMIPKNKVEKAKKERKLEVVE
jgi:hypothetical protein